MSEEDLERTGILKDMLKKEDEEEMTINETIEEFLEKLEYLDIDNKKKTKIKSLANEILKENDDKAKEFLFNELKKIVHEP
jgi:glucose-6-phosphate 1-dehydrogenase